MFIFSNFLPCIAEIGKKLALPKLFFLKYSINLLASFSSCVTMFCIVAPKHISIAVSYSLLVEIRLAKAPYTPLFKFESFSHANNKDFTLFMYPSFSFSVSCKNFNLEFFILYSSESLFILSSNSFILAIASSFFVFVSLSLLIALFLTLSISKNPFDISCFSNLAASNSEIIN